jgi:hypothetical protein
MYPAEDLKRLELRKLRARLAILAHRQQCIAAGQELAATVDELEVWRGRIMQWKSMLKFAPGIFGLFKLFRGKKPRSPEDSDGFGEARPKGGRMATALSWLTTGLRAYNTFRGSR